MTFFAGVEPLDLADLVAGGAGGAAGDVVAGAELNVAGGGVADEQPGGLAQDAGDRDEGSLFPARTTQGPTT